MCLKINFFFLQIAGIFLALHSSLAMASSFYVGHNLAPGTETPSASTWTVGSYLIGYAPTDSCFVGTNAWMAWDYNSYSAIARCRVFGEQAFFPNPSWFDESSLQLAYIQSDKSLGDAYRQTVGSVWWTIQHKFTDNYSLYTTLNFMHFWDETLPFSLRREPGNDQPFQFTLSTLQRVAWTPTAGFAFEFGILGLNYHKPLVHNGYSVYKMGANYLVQVGLSISALPNNFDRLYEQPDARSRSVNYDYSVHPELQLQYFF